MATELKNNSTATHKSKNAITRCARRRNFSQALRATHSAEACRGNFWLPAASLEEAVLTRG
jgi:hypothetical protein